jgi:hypothetical protein
MASGCTEVIDMSHAYRASLYPTPCPAADVPALRHAERALAYAPRANLPARPARVASCEPGELAEDERRRRGAMTHRVSWPNWC